MEGIVVMDKGRWGGGGQKSYSEGKPWSEG